MGATVLYLDPWSGVSGDMLLAALLDTDRETGRLEQVLRLTIDALGLEATTVHVSRDVERGIACTRVRVDDGGAQPLRHLADMETLIERAPLPARVRTGALRAIRRLAGVEAQVHACAEEDLHFHEVGAVDTLVDVVGTLSLVEALEVERVYVGTIQVGGGSVVTAHGRVSVPAPATARLLEGYPIVGGPEAMELTTPTGALLVSELGAEVGYLPAMRTQRVGYGGGSLKLKQVPNVLRVVIGSAEVGSRGADMVVELETNLDDVSPEVVGHTVRRLREAGALDVWLIPAQMKKDRPGFVLHALVKSTDDEKAMGVIFEETGTLGIRRQTVSRVVADRGTVKVTVEGETISVKWGRRQGRLIAVAAEFDDSEVAAANLDLPLRGVMSAAEQAAREILEESGE